MPTEEEKLEYLRGSPTRFELLRLTGLLSDAVQQSMEVHFAEDGAAKFEALGVLNSKFGEILKFRAALGNAGTDPQTGFEL